jgi:hypothetical protein
LANEIDKVATGTASGVEDAHGIGDSTAEQLVEEINIDVAEFATKGIRRLRHVSRLSGA